MTNMVHFLFLMRLLPDSVLPSVEQTEFFGIRPDMVTYGKIIGAGMPVGAYGGRKEIMEMVSPAGPVYQAGTLSGNPIAMAAGLTQLKYLYEHQEVYKELEAKGRKLYQWNRTDS